MEYKGYKFRRNHKMITLPNFDEQKNPMPYVEEGQENYIYFGKVIESKAKKPINAIKTNYKWSDTGEFVYAIPLELKGHSLTNMAYGNKEQIYLAKDGACYQAKIKRV